MAQIMMVLGNNIVKGIKGERKFFSSCVIPFFSFYTFNFMPLILQVEVGWCTILAGSGGMIWQWSIATSFIVIYKKSEKGLLHHWI